LNASASIIDSRDTAVSCNRELSRKESAAGLAQLIHRVLVCSLKVLAT
jgi:hypothetical protein